MKLIIKNSIRCLLVTVTFAFISCMSTEQAQFQPWSGAPQPIPSDKLAQIKKGKTTKAQVVEILGPPNHQWPGLMSYENVQSNFPTKTIGGSFVPGAALLTPSSVNAQSIQIWLSPGDVVKDVIVNRTESNGSYAEKMTGQKPVITQTSGSQ